MQNPKIITITPQNCKDHRVACFINPKNEGYFMKQKWLKERFKDGLQIKLLFSENSKTPNGFIEYVPGESAWRAVEAEGYMFIHCIWMNPTKMKSKGYGSFLVNEATTDAQKQNMNGVAAITSEGPFMADQRLFEKNGFKSVEESGNFNLMVKTFKKAPLPKFRDWESQLKKLKGIHVIYSNQCPWVSRSIKEIAAIGKEKGLAIKFTELKTPKEAQDAPSIYAVFNLVKDGKSLANHYISTRRFLNIVNKELD